MKPLPKACPICEGKNLIVSKFHCPDCQSSIEGEFVPGQNAFQGLSEDQMNFMLTFVRCEGKLNRMEEILGLSYPTLKNRLNDVILALGFQPEKESPFKLSASQRQQILEDLEAGRIDADQALRYLQGEDKFYLN